MTVVVTEFASTNEAEPLERTWAKPASILQQDFVAFSTINAREFRCPLLNLLPAIYILSIICSVDAALLAFLWLILSKGKARGTLRCKRLFTLFPSRSEFHSPAFRLPVLPLACLRHWFSWRIIKLE